MVKSLLLAAALSLAGLLLIARSVAAGLQVALPTQHQPRVTGPIQLTIQSPTKEEVVRGY
jgi:hypothetical protein